MHDAAEEAAWAVPHLDQESLCQTNLSSAPGAAAARMPTLMPGAHSMSVPPSTETRHAPTCTGNFRVVTLPAESVASTQMFTSPATSGTQEHEGEAPLLRTVPHLAQPPCSQTNLYLTDPVLPDADRPSSHSSPSRGDPPSDAFAVMPSREKSSDWELVLAAESSERITGLCSLAYENRAVMGRISKAKKNAPMNFWQTTLIGISYLPKTNELDRKNNINN